MIGLLVITHESVAQAFNTLSCHFFGEKPNNVRLLNVCSHDNPDVILQQAQAMALELNTGSGVLLLTDIFGATPFNIAKKLIQNHDVILLTGLNAPMMIKAIQNSSQEADIKVLATIVRQAAIDGIIEINLESHKNL